MKSTSGMVSVLDLIIPSLLRKRYLFTCSPMTIIMWPFWFVAVLDASFIPVAGQRPTSAANPPAPLLLSIDRTDRLTDGRTDTRSFYDAYRIRRRPRNNHHEVLFQRTLSVPVRLSAFFAFPGFAGSGGWLHADSDRGRRRRNVINYSAIERDAERGSADLRVNSI